MAQAESRLPTMKSSEAIFMVALSAGSEESETKPFIFPPGCKNDNANPG
jgi:hypothetical protein